MVDAAVIALCLRLSLAFCGSAEIERAVKAELTDPNAQFSHTYTQRCGTADMFHGTVLARSRRGSHLEALKFYYEDGFAWVENTRDKAALKRAFNRCMAGRRAQLVRTYGAEAVDGATKP